jgi:hypothetical protein
MMERNEETLQPNEEMLSTRDLASPNEAAPASPNEPRTASPNEAAPASPDEPRTASPNEAATASPDEPGTASPNKAATASPDDTAGDGNSAAAIQGTDQVGTDSPGTPQAGTPGSAAGTTDRDSGSSEPLLPADLTATFQDRWEEIQTRFVDEPRGAVEDADGLVANLMQRLAESFAQERERLEAQWGRGEDISTEELRVALQRYRSFFQRLLATY